MGEILGIKAALFDLDGLIADTEEQHVISYHKMAKELGIKLNEEYIHSFIGVATKDNVNKIIKDFNINRNFKDVLNLRYKYYLEEIKNSDIRTMKGAEEVILFLRKLGLKTALVTSSIKEQAIEVLKKIFNTYISIKYSKFNIELFDTMVFGDEVHNPKPNPEIYLMASNILKVKPKNCLVFEDSEAGTVSAKSAGMHVIAVPNYHTKNQNFKKADYTISSLEEFINKYQLLIKS